MILLFGQPLFFLTCNGLIPLDQLKVRAFTFNTNPHYHLIRKMIISFPVISLLFISARSQISPVYSKHYNYEQFVNPAITGRDYYPVVNFAHKKYWLGTKDSPSTTCIGASMRLGTYNFYTPRMMVNRSKFTSKSRVGLGGFIMHETDGPLNYLNGTLTYSYFIPFNNASTQLSFGISAQFHSYSVNMGMLDPLDDNDPELMKLNDKKLVPEAGFGVYLHDDQFFAGLSVNDLLLSDLPLDDNDHNKNKRDFFFQTGYKFFLKRFELEPSIFIAKINNTPLYKFASLKLYYMNYNWFAVSYRSTKSFMVSAGLRLSRFYLAYNYEHSVSKMMKYFEGSHEIMLGVNIGLYKVEGIRKVVREQE